jgi:serine/threonine protein kinase
LQHHGSKDPGALTPANGTIMAKTVTKKDVVSLLRSSQLLREEELSDAVAKFIEEGGELNDSAQFLKYLQKAKVLTPFQASLLNAGKYRGFVFGSYKLLDLIGQGGMGHVFLGQHMTTGRPVAVKTLNLKLANDEVARQRFFREAKVAASLAHPNIVRVFDLEASATPPYIVMEYIDGLNLQAMVARAGTFRAEWAAYCGVQIAQGLQCAADAKLVHRDIKPANLLMDRNGLCKILDLGIVRVATDTVLTMSGAGDIILGTADYLAPEQAIDSSNVDCRADIYALGCTLYFLLAGHPPYPTGSSQAKLIAKQTSDPPRIDHLRPDIPEDLADVIHTMMARNRENRYSQPQYVAEALEPFAQADLDFHRKLFADPKSQAETVLNSQTNDTTNATNVRKFNAGDTPLPAAHSSIRLPSSEGTHPTLEAMTPPQNNVFDFSQQDAQATARVSLDEVMEAIPEKHRPAFEKPKPPNLLTQHRMLIALAGLGLFVVIGAAVVLYLLFGGKAKPATVTSIPTNSAISPFVDPNTTLAKTAARRNILIVSKQRIPGAHPTVASAIAAANNDTRIEIIDPTWSEELSILLTHFIPLDLVIAGNHRGGPVTWTGNPDAKLGAAINVANSRGITFQNFILEGTPNYAATIYMCASGVRIQDCTIKPASFTAVQFHHVPASTKPSRLENCRIVTTKPAPTAVFFPASHIYTNTGIEVVDNLIEGPFEAGILFQGNSNAITIERNRLVNCQAGMRFDTTHPSPVGAPVVPASMQILISRNNFINLPIGLKFPSLPDASGTSLLVKENVFDSVQTLSTSPIVGPLNQIPYMWNREQKNEEGVANQDVFFRGEFTLTAADHKSPWFLDFHSYLSAQVFINGILLQPATTLSSNITTALDLQPHLRVGKNVVAIQLTAGATKAAPGLLATISSFTPVSATPAVPATSPGTKAPAPPLANPTPAVTWKCLNKPLPQWPLPEFDDSTWTPAVTMKMADGRPYVGSVIRLTSLEQMYPGYNKAFRFGPNNIVTSKQSVDGVPLISPEFDPKVILGKDPSKEETYLRVSDPTLKVGVPPRAKPPESPNSP